MVNPEAGAAVFLEIRRKRRSSATLQWQSSDFIAFHVCDNVPYPEPFFSPMSVET